MKMILILLLVIAYSGNLISQTIQWTAKEQSTVTENGLSYTIPTGGLDVCTDSENNAYVTGYFAGTSNHEPNETPWGAYLNKYDENGVLLWSRKLQYADLSISIDNKDIIHLSGMDSTGYFVSKFHKDGTEFAKTILFPKGVDYPAMIKGIATDAARNYYIIGTYRGIISFGTTTFNNSLAENHLFLAKYNLTGVLIWARSSVSGHAHFGTGIKTDSLGNCYIHSDYNGVFTMDNHTISASLFDAFVGKYDTNGNPLWLYTTGGSGMQAISSIQVDGDQNVFLLGNSNKTFIAGTSTVAVEENDVNLFIIRLNLSGNVVYAKSLGSGSNLEIGGGIDIDKHGEIFISGTFHNSTTIGNITLVSSSSANEAFMAKLDNQANVSWAIQSGSDQNGQSYGCGVALDNNSNMFVTGDFSGTHDFNGNPLTGDKFLFIAKILPGIPNGLRKNSSPIQEFTVYPIPSTGTFRASMLLNKQSNFEIKLLNTMGDILYSEKIQSTYGTFIKDFDLEEYPKGVYFIEIITEGKKAIQQQVIN